MVTSATVILPNPRARGWLVMLGLLFMFAAGTANGVGLTIVIAVHRIENAIHRPEIVPPRLTKYLKRKLNLNDSQSTEVLSVITQRQHRLDQIRLKFRPDVQQQLMLLRAQISDLLDPSQELKRFELFDSAKDRRVPGPVQTSSTQSID